MRGKGEKMAAELLQNGTSATPMCRYPGETEPQIAASGSWHAVDRTNSLVLRPSLSYRLHAKSI